MAIRLLPFRQYAEEDVVGCLKRLSLRSVDFEIGLSVVVEGFRVFLEMLVSNCSVVVFLGTSIEFPDGNWIDWLLQN